MKEHAQIPVHSVWGKAQHSSGHGLKHGSLAPQDSPGRLVAVTATGPVHQARVHLAVVPLSVGLALTQELAARVLQPKARVVSSLANRVSGEAAMSAWLNVCGYSAATLLHASPHARVGFLRQVLTYVRRQGNVNGLESVLASAVNAAWPWIEHAALTRILPLISRYMKASEFAAASMIPVVDPNTRTFTVFAPGELAKLDPDDWLVWQVDLPNRPGMPNSSTGNPGMGGLSGLGVPGQRGGPDLTGFGGPDLSGNGDPSMGGLSGLGVPGQRGGPDLSGFGGPDLSGNGDPSMGGLSGLGVPGQRGGPDLSGLGGPNLSGNNDPGMGGLSGLGVPGQRGPNLGNLGGNGGPYGFGSGLGVGGAANPNDADKTIGNKVATFGGILMGIGGGAIVGGALGLGGGPVMIGGAAVFAVGLGTYIVGSIIEVKADAEKPGPAEPAPSGSEPAPEPDKPVSVPVVTRPAEPKPEEPKHNDLYPDPDGTGGGNPTQLPDFEGGGGGPTRLWDENGGGGNPNTIWDENGGGGNPTTTGAVVGLTTLSGRGLLASVVQVGPRTFAF